MPTKTSLTQQVAVRIRHDTHKLLKRDAGKFRGISTVINAIVEDAYKDELAYLRQAKPRKPRV